LLIATRLQAWILVRIYPSSEHFQITIQEPLLWAILLHHFIC